MSKYLSIQIILLTFATWIVGSSYPMTRGKSVAPSTLFMTDVTKKTDEMAKKKSLAEVKSAFHEVWGDRYIYDHITEENYVNTTTKVVVECREHGLFKITPSHHIGGVGCRACQYKKLRESPCYKNRSLFCGVGVFDADCSLNTNPTIHKSSEKWRGMLTRCYDKSNMTRRPSYHGCYVCEEWKIFSNFNKWFCENYVDGYALDKDILVKGNKVYSPDTCCFVPQEINSLIVTRKRGRGNCPIGVTGACGKNRYSASYSVGCTRVYVGTFNTPEEAFAAYKVAKEAHIKEVAEKYYREGKINERVYNALINYKVEITD